MQDPVCIYNMTRHVYNQYFKNQPIMRPAILTDVTVSHISGRTPLALVGPGEIVAGTPLEAGISKAAFIYV